MNLSDFWLCVFAELSMDASDFFFNFYYISIAADQIGMPYLQSVVSQPKTLQEAFCMVPIMLSAVIWYSIDVMLQICSQTCLLYLFIIVYLKIVFTV